MEMHTSNNSQEWSSSYSTHPINTEFVGSGPAMMTKVLCPSITLPHPGVQMGTNFLQCWEGNIVEEVWWSPRATYVLESGLIAWDMGTVTCDLRSYASLYLFSSLNVFLEQNIYYDSYETIFQSVRYHCFAWTSFYVQDDKTVQICFKLLAPQFDVNLLFDFVHLQVL